MFAQGTKLLAMKWTGPAVLGAPLAAGVLKQHYGRALSLSTEYISAQVGGVDRNDIDVAPATEAVIGHVRPGGSSLHASQPHEREPPNGRAGWSIRPV